MKRRLIALLFREPMTAAELGAELGRHKSELNPLLYRLEKEGVLDVSSDFVWSVRPVDQDLGERDEHQLEDDEQYDDDDVEDSDDDDEYEADESEGDDDEFEAAFVVDRSYEVRYEPDGSGSRPDEMLREALLRVTAGGEKEFFVGITFRPSSRTWSYAQRGFSTMYVLCSSPFYGAIRKLELRLNAWAHGQRLNVRNTRNTPPGKKASKYRQYLLYVVV